VEPFTVPSVLDHRYCGACWRR